MFTLRRKRPMRVASFGAVGSFAVSLAFVTYVASRSASRLGISTMRSASSQHTSPIRAFAARSRGGSIAPKAHKAAGSTAAVNTAPATRESAEHDAYDVVKIDDINEYGARATLFRHKKTGAEVLSVEKDDENKVFGIVFRTPPTDSTGIPHILEHSVLCGSRKYPIKEPFTELMKSSLNTFLNAFTYPDRTCYPVASQNLKDFYNLVNVYLDAVFFPRAVSDPQVLAQEGWHYELDKEDDALTRKGVVYNEMKGVYSQPDNIMGKVEMETLFPDNTYGVDSGGDPKVIPSLTFNQFKDFHSSKYHPSNARVYFYGDDPVQERLELLDSYLSEFEKKNVDTKVEWQPLWKEPKTIKASFPSNSEEGKYMASVNWVVHEEPLSSEEKLATSVLSHLLMGNSAAILRKTLTDSGLGEQVLGGAFDDTLQQMVFSAGLKGMKSEEDSLKVEKLVTDTLERLSKEGFPDEAVAASINTIEFRLREFNTGGYPKGLMFMLGALGEWIYDRDPVDGLRFEKDLQSLKDKLANKEPVFENIIKKYLLENNHRLAVTMVPDAQLEEKETEKETKELESIKSKLSSGDVTKIVQETKTLKDAQAAEDSPENMAKMPKLTLEDLDKKQKEIPIQVETVSEGTKLLTHDLSTSGIMYMDIGLDMRVLPVDDLPLIPLFERMLTEAGTKNRDNVALSQYIGTHTGGVGVSHFISQKVDGNKVSDPNSVVGYLTLRAKCVPEKISTMLEIAEEVLTSAKLDNKQRMVEMLKETKAGLEAGIVGSGHRYAAGRLSARFTAADSISETMGGISYLNTVKELLEQAENDWPTLQKRLEGMRAALLSTKGDGRMLINLTADKKLLDSSRKDFDSFIDRIHKNTVGSGSTEIHDWAKEIKTLEKSDEGFPVPTQVNYVAFGGQLYKPGNDVSGASQVISKFLSTGFLWDNVRVIGGAYGGFCGFDPVSGVFRFLSYRDPNLVNTIDNYKAASEYLAGLNLSQEELEKAIIGCIGDVDSPMSVDQKGFASFQRWIIGRTQDDLQTRRDQILGTTAEDFRAFGRMLQDLNKEGDSVVIGSKGAFESAEKEMESKFKLLEIL